MFQIVLQFQSLEELLNYAKQSDRLSNKKQKLESQKTPSVNPITGEVKQN